MLSCKRGQNSPTLRPKFINLSVLVEECFVDVKEEDNNYLTLLFSIHLAYMKNPIFSMES
jgi:hypothetical protein